MPGYTTFFLSRYPDIHEALLANGMDQAAKNYDGERRLRLALYLANTGGRCSNRTAANILGYKNPNSWKAWRCRYHNRVEEDFYMLFDDESAAKDWRESIRKMPQFILRRDTTGFWYCAPTHSIKSELALLEETRWEMLWTGARNSRDQGRRTDPRELNLPTEFGLPKRGNQ